MSDEKEIIHQVNFKLRQNGFRTIHSDTSSAANVLMDVLNSYERRGKVLELHQKDRVEGHAEDESGTSGEHKMEMDENLENALQQEQQDNFQPQERAQNDQMESLPQREDEIREFGQVHPQEHADEQEGRTSQDQHTGPNAQFKEQEIVKPPESSQSYTNSVNEEESDNFSAPKIESSNILQHESISTKENNSGLSSKQPKDTEIEYGSKDDASTSHNQGEESSTCTDALEFEVHHVKLNKDQLPHSNLTNQDGVHNASGHIPQKETSGTNDQVYESEDIDLGEEVPSFIVPYEEENKALEMEREKHRKEIRKLRAVIRKLANRSNVHSEQMYQKEIQLLKMQLNVSKDREAIYHRKYTELKSINDSKNKDVQKSQNLQGESVLDLSATRLRLQLRNQEDSMTFGEEGSSSFDEYTESTGTDSASETSYVLTREAKKLVNHKEVNKDKHEIESSLQEEIVFKEKLLKADDTSVRISKEEYADLQNLYEVMPMLQATSSTDLCDKIRRLLRATQTLPKLQKFVVDICESVSDGKQILGEGQEKIYPKDVNDQINAWIFMLQKYKIRENNNRSRNDSARTNNSR